MADITFDEHVKDIMMMASVFKEYIDIDINLMDLILMRNDQISFEIRIWLGQKKIYFGW